MWKRESKVSLPGRQKEWRKGRIEATQKLAQKIMKLHRYIKSSALQAGICIWIISH